MAHSVLCLSRDMVEALAELGVKAPFDRGLCQAFPADRHNTFGSATSYWQLPFNRKKPSLLRVGRVKDKNERDRTERV